MKGGGGGHWASLHRRAGEQNNAVRSERLCESIFPESERAVLLRGSSTGAVFRGWAGSEELPRHNKLWRIAEGGGGGYRLSQCKCWLEGVGTCCLHCLSQATGGKTLLVGDSDRPLPLGGGSPRRLRCTAVRRLSIQYSLGGGGGGCGPPALHSRPRVPC